MPLIIVLYSLFASVFTIAKIGLGYTQPFFFVGTRMVFAGVLMLAYMWFTNPNSVKIHRGTVKRLLALAFFNIYLTNAMEFWGLKYLTSFKTCFIYSLSPFMAALFSFLVFDERMTNRKWIGLSIGFMGFVPILFQMGGQDAEMIYGGIFSLPELAVVVAAIASSYGWIVMRQLIREDGYHPMIANGFSMLVGGFFALAHSGLAETWQPFPVTDYVVFTECTLLLVLISNILAYNLYGFLLKRFTATFLSFSGFMCPLLAAFFGWLVLGETITLMFMSSAAVVFAGLIVFYQEELRIGVRLPEEPVPAASTELVESGA
ncbi:MAG: DMT family transporter [Chlamydiales bacterium]|nr:DMT family transporter [Chlamydiales bacterium]